VANRDASFAVERDYYKKAVEWDQAMAQHAANAELGWQVSARLEPAGDGRARLTVWLSDRGGLPLDGATVSVEAFASARAGDVRALALEPLGDGAYAGTLAAPRAGVWELRLAVTRSGRRFTQVVHDELRAGAPIAATAPSPGARIP
jgi:nitrogen fixation protein FixH